jgi:Catechol dioxygenase N terminus
MTSLIRHVHDFARENELTVDEWMKGVELINWAGQMSNDRRNEGQLVCDVIGLESYALSLFFSLLRCFVMSVLEADSQTASWTRSPIKRPPRPPTR